MTKSVLDVEATSLDAIVEEFEGASLKLLRMVYPTRSVDRMRSAVDEADRWITRLRGFKEGARRKDYSETATLLLGMQCFAAAVAEELKMWIDLRDGHPHSAWDHLIDAQEYLAIALQASPAVAVDEAWERTHVYEKRLFPAMMFASCGFLYNAGDCNICGVRFDECDHDEGVIYAGRVCREENLRNVKLLEISLVFDPRDKRCIATAIEDEDGVMRDVFTWDVVEHDSTENEASDKRIEGKLMHFVGYSFKQLEGVFH